jgi:hypothetical protein
MAETASTFLTAWASFYVLTGTSAATLTGLMFVVLTLVARTERLRRAREGTATFSTPTVMHFGAALLISGVLAAPWRSLLLLSIMLMVASLIGVVYMVYVMLRTRRLSIYIADLEDWLWYSILPFVSYGVMLAGAIGLLAAPAAALFVLAGSVLFLIFIGIRNSWDIVTFIATGQADELDPNPEDKR